MLVRLGVLSKDAELLARAAETFDAFLGLLQRAPRGTESLILAASMYLATDHAKGAARRIAEGPTPDASAEGETVRLAVFADRLTVKPGAKLEVAVRLTIADGWHVNSTRPAQSHLVATGVVLKTGPAARGEVSAPNGKPVELAFSETPVNVYEGTVWLRVPITIKDDATTGRARLVLAVTTQSCNDRLCQAPATQELPLDVTVDPNAAEEPARHKDVFDSLK